MYVSELIIHAIDELDKNAIFTGRTNIHKVIFFAINAKKLILEYYRPYHYGPYSADV